MVRSLHRFLLIVLLAAGAVAASRAASGAGEADGEVDTTGGDEPRTAKPPGLQKPRPSRSSAPT